MVPASLNDARLSQSTQVDRKVGRTWRDALASPVVEARAHTLRCPRQALVRVCGALEGAAHHLAWSASLGVSWTSCA